MSGVIGETSPADEAFKSSLWWLQRAATVLNTSVSNNLCITATPYSLYPSRIRSSHHTSLESCQTFNRCSTRPSSASPSCPAALSWTPLARSPTFRTCSLANPCKKPSLSSSSSSQSQSRSLPQRTQVYAVSFPRAPNWRSEPTTLVTPPCLCIDFSRSSGYDAYDPRYDPTPNLLERRSLAIEKSMLLYIPAVVVAVSCCFS